MRSALLIPAVALLLAACGTPRETTMTWYKPGSGSVQLQQQHRECRTEAYNTPGASQMQAALLLDRCMAAKGWQRVEADANGCARVTASDGQVRSVCN